MAHQNDLPATQGQHGWSREKGYFATGEAKAKEVVAEVKDGGLEEVIDRHIEGEQESVVDEAPGSGTGRYPEATNWTEVSDGTDYPPAGSTSEEKSSDPSAADLDAQAADDQAAIDTKSAPQE